MNETSVRVDGREHRSHGVHVRLPEPPNVAVLVAHQAGRVEDETAIRGRTPDRLMVEQLTANDVDAGPLEERSIRLRADERAHRVAALDETSDEMAAEEPRRPGDEDVHRGRAKTTRSVIVS